MSQFDVCVIGAGPGGYVAAIRSAQLGLKTVIIEREKLGGVCLNVGCIPSKAMISAAHFLHRMQHDAPTMGFEIKGDVKLDAKKLQSWKQSVCDKMSGGVQQLLKGNSVQIVSGDATFVDAKTIQIKTGDKTEKITAKNYIIATGSRPIEIPGFAFDEKDIMSSTGALAMESLPKSLAVIGGGYIGLEIGGYLNQLGVEVHVFEANDGLLKGVADPEVVQVVARKLKKDGVNVYLKSMAQGFTKKGKQFELKV